MRAVYGIFVLVEQEVEVEEMREDLLYRRRLKSELFLEQDAVSVGLLDEGFGVSGIFLHFDY